MSINALAQDEIGLDEIAAPASDQNAHEHELYQHQNLENGNPSSTRKDDTYRTQDDNQSPPWLTQLYIASYLVFFSIFGVLARIGLQALTIYPGALVPNTDLWANVGGSLIMGILREDRMLFRRHWKQALDKARMESNSTSDDTVEEVKHTEVHEQARTAFASAKKEIPAYIGLSVGFCGSFTSFASICRDAFLAIASDINTAAISSESTTTLPRVRPAGDSVMALFAVLVLEVGLSTVALACGAHLAIALVHSAERIPVWNLSRLMNPLVVFLGFGCWLGAVLMAIWPVKDAWRGQVLFSLVFAPLGCLLRFQLSLRMNRLVASFPFGTFTANILGTCVLGMCYDLQMSSIGAGIASCQVLQGVMDGFCGALTTVSTWVLELDTLKLKHAYFYGVCSIFLGVGVITAIMGSLRWTRGFEAASCIT